MRRRCPAGCRESEAVGGMAGRPWPGILQLPNYLIRSQLSNSAAVASLLSQPSSL